MDLCALCCTISWVSRIAAYGPGSRVSEGKAEIAYQGDQRNVGGDNPCRESPFSSRYLLSHRDPPVYLLIRLSPSFLFLYVLQGSDLQCLLSLNVLVTLDSGQRAQTPPPDHARRERALTSLNWFALFPPSLSRRCNGGRRFLREGSHGRRRQSPATIAHCRRATAPSSALPPQKRPSAVLCER